MIDYLVVGLGLAGTSFCETLLKNHKRFVVFNDDSQTSTLVAGGLYNPVILKRFTLSWKATEQLAFANDFYADLQKRLGINFDYKIPVYRRFASTEEQNLWFEASDRPQLAKFISTHLIQNKNPNLKANHGFGQVLHTGKLDTFALISSFKDWLSINGLLKQGTFNHESLQFKEGYFQYKEIKARNIVFAEGYGLKKNPFFNYLPLYGSKGEYLIIKSKQLREVNIIKSSIFIIPLGEDVYKVGATYNRKDKNNLPTECARAELLRKLKDLIACDYEVINHVAGMRPTVKDRRPLVGEHPKHKKMWVLNGFGSHGIMIGPWAAEKLVNHMVNDTLLDMEMNIERFREDYDAINPL